MTRQVFQRDTTDRRFRLIFDELLGLRRTVPMSPNESAFFEFLFELLITIYFTRVGDTEIECFLQQILRNQRL